MVVAESGDFEAFIAAVPASSPAPENTLWTGKQSGGTSACIAFESATDLTISLGVSSGGGLAFGPYGLRVTDMGPLPLGCRVIRPGEA